MKVLKKVKSRLLKLTYSHNNAKHNLFHQKKKKFRSTPFKLQANQTETPSYSTHLKSSCTHAVLHAVPGKKLESGKRLALNQKLQG